MTCRRSKRSSVRPHLHVKLVFGPQVICARANHLLKKRLLQMICPHRSQLKQNVTDDRSPTGKEVSADHPLKILRLSQDDLCAPIIMICDQSRSDLVGVDLSFVKSLSETFLSVCRVYYHKEWGGGAGGGGLYWPDRCHRSTQEQARATSPATKRPSHYLTSFHCFEALPVCRGRTDPTLANQTPFFCFAFCLFWFLFLCLVLLCMFFFYHSDDVMMMIMIYDDDDGSDGDDDDDDDVVLGVPRVFIAGREGGRGGRHWQGFRSGGGGGRDGRGGRGGRGRGRGRGGFVPVGQVRLCFGAAGDDAIVLSSFSFTVKK